MRESRFEPPPPGEIVLDTHGLNAPTVCCTKNAGMRSTVPFDRVQHLLRVPVRVNGDAYQFLIDTGIGISVVSSAVAARSDVSWLGDTFTGRRMSGQTVHTQLVQLPRLKLGEYAVDGHVAGVVDLGEVEGPDGFAGILGPAFFDDQVVTTDPDAQSLTVQHRNGLDLDGHEIPLEIRRDGISVDPFTTLCCQTVGRSASRWTPAQGT